MRRRRTVAIVLTAAVLLAAAICAQHVRRGSIAVIKSDELEYDWGTGVTEMTGNVRVEIKGKYDATMTASSIIVKTDIGKSRVLSFEARGPVTFDVLTEPVNGQRSHITAQCSESATFSELTMVVKLQGNAHAEITGAGALVEQLESAKYDGESMTINLIKRTIRAKHATAEIQMLPEAEKPEAAEGNG